MVRLTTERQWLVLIKTTIKTLTFLLVFCLIFSLRKNVLQTEVGGKPEVVEKLG